MQSPRNNKMKQKKYNKSEVINTIQVQTMHNRNKQQHFILTYMSA